MCSLSLQSFALTTPNYPSDKKETFVTKLKVLDNKVMDIHVNGDSEVPLFLYFAGVKYP